MGMPPRQRFYGDWKETGKERGDIRLPFSLIDPRGKEVMAGVPGTNPVKMVPKICEFTPAEVARYKGWGYQVINVDPLEVRRRADLD